MLKMLLSKADQTEWPFSELNPHQLGPKQRIYQYEPREPRPTIASPTNISSLLFIKVGELDGQTRKRELRLPSCRGGSVWLLPFSYAK